MSGVISDNTVRSSGVVAPLTSATLDASNPAKDTNPTDGLGTKWINTTSGQIFICTDATADANEWVGQEGTNIPPTFMGNRAVFAGGMLTGGGSPTVTNVIQFASIDSPGNCQDFGDLTEARGGGPVGASGEGRGTFAGGYTAPGNSSNIDYITISNTGNASLLGDLTADMSGQGASDGIRGFLRRNGTADIYLWTIASSANASDYADLNYSTNYGLASGCSTDDRIFWAGGHDGTATTYDYISYKSTLNNTICQDFGNLYEAVYQTAGTSNGTYGFIVGGHNQAGAVVKTIQRITISTPGNASDFGDLVGGPGSGISMSGACAGTPARCLCATGGNHTGGNSFSDKIDYWNPASPSNATAFGELIDPTNGSSALSGD